MPLAELLLASGMSERKPKRLETLDASLERRMADCGLSNDTRQFLRDLHAAEKQLNDAFQRAHQGGALEARVSAVYRRMYGRG
jgi:hypothetical protein